jgi:hypothetical protein
MKKELNLCLAGLLMILLIIVPSISNGQSEKAVIKKYLMKLATVPVSNTLHKYRITAVYTNMDLYGNFSGKIKVTGDYTRGLEKGFVSWDNVYLQFKQCLRAFSDLDKTGIYGKYKICSFAENA